MEKVPPKPTGPTYVVGKGNLDCVVTKAASFIVLTIFVAFELNI